MIAVIFEVWPKTERKQDYLNIAAELKPLLEKIDGFISIERFESLYQPGKILSLSFFRDEAAVQAWRKTSEHRVAQGPGWDDAGQPRTASTNAGGVEADHRRNEIVRTGASVSAHEPSERRKALGIPAAFVIQVGLARMDSDLHIGPFDKAVFATTHWSVVLAAGHSSAPTAGTGAH